MSRTEGRSDSESIKVIFLGSTDKAWKVAAVGKREETWVPISQCELVPANPKEGEECWLMIPQWLLDKKEELT